MRIQTLREDIELEFKSVDDNFSELNKQFSKLTENSNKTTDVDDKSLNKSVRNLQSKVQNMYEEGLKLKQIKIDSACRSKHKSGVVIVTLKSIENKKSGSISQSKYWKAVR